MSRIFVGVDPGLKGGLVMIEDDGPPRLMTMPSVKVGTKTQIDEQCVRDWFSYCVVFKPNVIVTIELVHSMPKQGVVSTFNFGLGWGLVRGICCGLGLPYQLVRPQEWKKVMLKGHPKGSEYLVASRLWPDADWKRTPRCTIPHDGLVDAALIAEYGRRQHQGENDD